MATKPTASTNAKNRIQTYRKMMDVLHSFSRVDRQLPLATIAANAGLPRATAHRILTALREIGFIEQDTRRGTYSLGLGLFELGSLVLANMDLVREAKPFIDELTQGSGTAAHLGVFNGMEVVVVEREDQPDRPIRTVRPVEAAPAYCTGLGKAVLAFQAKDVVDRIIGAGLKRYTRNTLTSAAALRQDLTRVRQRGYAIDNGEHHCLQHSPIVKEGAEAATGAVRGGERALYYWIYPNFMINWYEGVMDTNLVLPLGVDRTEVIFDFYFPDVTSEEARRRNLASIDVGQRIQDEDTAICRSVQRGLTSRAYDAGRLSVRREAGEHLFHRLLHASLMEGLAE